MSFFFLEFGFRKRFTSFVTALSNSITSLSSKDKQIIEQKREHKHEALQKIFEAARKNKKPINFVKPSDSRPAKMVAPKSNFGWVMFDDNYEKPKKLGIPTTKTGDVMEVKLSNATETKPKKLEPKVEQPQGEHDIKPDGTVKKQKSAEIKQKINPKQLTAKNKINLEPTKEVKRSADTVIVDENIRKDLTTADKQILVTKKQIEPEEQVNTQEQVIQIDDRIKKIREMQEAVAEFQKGPKTKEQEREGLLGSILKKVLPFLPSAQA